MSIVERAIKKLQVATPQLSGTSGQPQQSSVVDTAPPTQPVGERRIPAPTPATPDLRIDRHVLRTAGLLPPENHSRVLAGQYRQIKRPLIAAAFGRGAEQLANGRLIVVSSALAGEGKTFTCMNLAMSIALERDTSVVLVDADVAKPHITRVLGLEGKRGLLDCVEDGRIDPESLVLSTDVPGLYVLPAGTRSETATELLASVRMERAAAHLLSTHSDRIVLFDSPPLLLTNESRALTQVAGQVVIVVRAGQTLQSDITAAIALVASNKPIGLVLNQSNEVREQQYHYASVDDDSLTDS